MYSSTTGSEPEGVCEEERFGSCRARDSISDSREASWVATVSSWDLYSLASTSRSARDLLAAESGEEAALASWRRTALFFSRRVRGRDLQLDPLLVEVEDLPRVAGLRSIVAR